MKAGPRILVQFLGPKGGVRSRRTFSGNMFIVMTKALRGALAEEELSKEEERRSRREAAERRKSAARCGTQHILRAGKPKDGKKKWTCRVCRRSVTVKESFNAFQAALSIAFEEGEERKLATSVMET